MLQKRTLVTREFPSRRGFPFITRFTVGLEELLPFNPQGNTLGREACCAERYPSLTPVSLLDVEERNVHNGEISAVPRLRAHGWDSPAHPGLISER